MSPHYTGIAPGVFLTAKVHVIGHASRFLPLFPAQALKQDSRLGRRWVPGRAELKLQLHRYSYSYYY